MQVSLKRKWNWNWGVIFPPSFSGALSDWAEENAMGNWGRSIQEEICWKGVQFSWTIVLCLNRDMKERYGEERTGGEMAGGGRERIWESEMNESCCWPPSLWSTEYEKILVWSRSQLSWLKCELSFLCSWFLLSLQQASSHCIFQSVLSAGSGWTVWPGKRADFTPLEHFDGERAERVSAFEWIKRGYRRDQWSRRHLRWAQVPEAIVLNLLLSQIHVQYKARACHNQMHALQPHQKTHRWFIL